MKKVSVLILGLIFLTNGLKAQYYLEHLKRWEQSITQFVDLPKPKEVEEFKNKPVLFVKEEYGASYEKKMRKKYKGKAEKLIAYRQKFAKRYNAALENFTKFYPYNVDTKIVSQSEYEKLKKKGDYSVVKIKNGGYLTAGISKKETIFYALPLTSEMVNKEHNIDVELKFFLQRMENYFKRMEQGSPASRKVFVKCKKELNERLETETKNKTLLIDKRYLAEGLKKSDLSKLLDIKFKLVEKSEIEELILNPSEEYWYVKVIPYQGFQKTGSSSFDSKKQTWKSGTSKTSRFSSGAHYIVDPTDGSAVLVNFMLSPEVDKNALKKYNSDLKSTKLSLRDK